MLTSEGKMHVGSVKRWAWLVITPLATQQHSLVEPMAV